MQISKDTLSVVNYLDEYSNGSLRKKNDIATILELGASSNSAQLLNKLIFSAKSCWNLFNKIKKIDSGTDGFVLIEKEFNKTMIEIENHLNELLEYADDEIIERFEKIYLANTQGSAKNIVDLSYDLSVLKNLQSEMKANN